jgi:hypothetical protein
MADEACKWVGASGASYLFYIYPVPASVPSRLGNYICCRQQSDMSWVPVHIGHGDLAVCDAEEATHIHMRLAALESERVEAHSDLVAAHKTAVPQDDADVREGAPAT